MQRAMSVIGLFAFVAARAAGQWLGMPSWNSPKGGRGVGIAADYGQPNADAGKGSAYGGRVSFGAGSALLTVGARSEEHTSELQSRTLISYAVFCLKKKKQ